MIKFDHKYLSNIDPNLFYQELNLDIPIDPWKIAQYFNIEVTQNFDWDKLGYSGEISWSKNKASINHRSN